MRPFCSKGGATGGSTARAHVSVRRATSPTSRRRWACQREFGRGTERAKEEPAARFYSLPITPWLSASGGREQSGASTAMLANQRSATRHTMAQMILPARRIVSRIHTQARFARRMREPSMANWALTQIKKRPPRGPLSDVHPVFFLVFDLMQAASLRGGDGRRRPRNRASLHRRAPRSQAPELTSRSRKKRRCSQSQPTGCTSPKSPCNC